LRNFRGTVQEFHVEFRENCMHFQYLLCKIPGEIPREFSSPTPYPGAAKEGKSAKEEISGYFEQLSKIRDAVNEEKIAAEEVDKFTKDPAATQEQIKEKVAARKAARRKKHRLSMWLKRDPFSLYADHHKPYDQAHLFDDYLEKEVLSRTGMKAEEKEQFQQSNPEKPPGLQLKELLDDLRVRVEGKKGDSKATLLDKRFEFEVYLFRKLV
jgi:hypothetical protein